MDRLRKLFTSEQPYEPIPSPGPHPREQEQEQSEDQDDPRDPTPPPFSYTTYTIFLLLGIAMLWAWNMFLAAGPYFSSRFASSPELARTFQPAEISLSTLTNLGAMLALTKMQKDAKYPRRIVGALGLNMGVFTLLAASTAVEGTAGGYFGFLMVMMVLASLGTSLCQNGVFAYVAGFGRGEYTQGIMTGQAVAGVLPCVAQIVSVLSVEGGGEGEVKGSAALVYFLTAAAVAVVTLAAFAWLLARRRGVETGVHMAEGGKESIPLLVLFRKLLWLALGVFITFAVTMVFPVYTQQIVSVHPPAQQGPLTQPPVFIPLAFLVWNLGDLAGRLLTALPVLSLVHRPRLVFGLAVSRLAFIPLYHLCNIHGQGAAVESDFFYLGVVQLLFGLTNGFLGSTCMIGAGEWVGTEEREAAGGFMGLCLVGGLAVGSLMSFFAAGG